LVGLGTCLRAAGIIDSMSVAAAGGSADLSLRAGSSLRLLARVDAWAEEALRYVATHDRFLVADLPGLADEDRILLCAKLVEAGVLAAVA
jgi:hypothetical protein